MLVARVDAQALGLDGGEQSPGRVCNVCVYIYIYIHIYIHTHTDTYMHARIYTYARTSASRALGVRLRALVIWEFTIIPPTIISKQTLTFK